MEHWNNRKERKRIDYEISVKACSKARKRKRHRPKKHRTGYSTVPVRDSAVIVREYQTGNGTKSVLAHAHLHTRTVRFSEMIRTIRETNDRAVQIKKGFT